MIVVLYQLRKLAEAYFHQDYDLQGGSPLGVIRLFREQESPDAVAELVSDIESVVQSRTEDQIDELWTDAWYAAYDPRDDGVSYHDWFGQVLAVLREPV